MFVPCNAHCRAVAVAALLVVVCSVLVLHGASHHGRRLGSFNTEAFAAGTRPNLQSLTRKTQAYFSAGLRWFFTDLPSLGGPDAMAAALMFSPSSNDVVCHLGSTDVKRMCSSRLHRIDHVSCADNTMLIRPSLDCSSRSVNVASEPTRASDCMVRVYRGNYSFSKVCVYASLGLERAALANRSNDDVRIILDPRSYAAKLIALSRCCFIKAPGSFLYSVQPTQATGQAALTQGQALFEFDSSSRRPYTLTLQRVSDALVADPHDGHSLRDHMLARGAARGTPLTAAAPVATPPVEVALTLYFLKYRGPYPGMGDDAVMTLYFVSQAATSSAPSFRTADGRSLVAGVKHEGGGSGQQIVTIHTAAAAKGDVSVLLPGDGMAVVTLTPRLLILCSMGPAGVRLRVLGSQAGARFTDQDFALAARIAGPPSRIAQVYDNRCIPNLADAAIRMGYT